MITSENDTQTPQETEEVFCIDTTDRAEWLLRKLANLDTEAARVQAQAAAMVRSLQSDRDGLMHLYSGQLENFTRTELARLGGRGKTLRTLQGSCSFRTVPAGLKMTELADALAYAQQQGLPILRTSVTLDTGSYRALAERRLRETGELLPGVEMAPERESFSLSFAKTTEE